MTSHKFRSLFTFILIGFVLAGQSLAQSSPYLVIFKDKDAAQWDPCTFSEKAIERRQNLGIPFPSWEDLPVNTQYLAELSARGLEIRHALRWFNGVSLMLEPGQLNQLSGLPFISEILPLEMTESLPAEWIGEAEDMPSDEVKLDRLFSLQRNLVEMEVLEKGGWDGSGLRIAVFDAGFTGYSDHVAFEHIRQAGHFLATKDFVKDKLEVDGHSGHGTAVLGCIAGMYKGRRIGAAVNAEFLLARTERAHREPISEEDNWMAAMEWADQQGADIISSSLGYAKKRYTYADMDGKTSLVARAAAIAVRKGILVVNSAGNEGAGAFHYIATPGDADSVLTIGASYPQVAKRMPFSSWGPNAAGVMKPEITGPGYVLSAHKGGGYAPAPGTSFACPMVAGLAACLWQAHREEGNMEIRQRILEAGHRFPYYDYEMGYGVFSCKRGFGNPEKPADEMLNIYVKQDTLWLEVDAAYLAKDSTGQASGRPLYFRMMKPDGKLDRAATFLIKPGQNRVGLPAKSLPEGKAEAWFEGFWWH